MGTQFRAQKRVRYQVSPSFASVILTDCRQDCRLGPVPIGYRSEGSLTAEILVHRWTGQVTPIDVFPDDVLLEMFDHYVDENPEAWQTLVHVCRRWRYLVFASQRRLNLRIVCTLGTPVRDMLNIWPALPLLVQGHIYETSSLDSIISALGHRNRVTGIDLWDLASSQLERVWAAMKGPFPELIDLRLRAFDRIAPLDPDLFMTGSAPRLQYLQLECIPCPGLPKLLMSTTHLVSLRLYDIPHSGYISPEAMVTCLSMLANLETLCLELRSFQSRPDREGQRLPLPTHSVLPSLVYFYFRGVGEYLEDLTSRVDVPRLNYLSINLTNEIEFDNPQLAQFIGRTPALQVPDEAHVSFDDSAGCVTLSSKESGGQFNVEISYGALEWQISALARVCNLSLPYLSKVEDLYICKIVGSRLNREYPMESENWLELLKPFTSVKNLYLSDDLTLRIAPALRSLVGSVIEVLPTLENIFLEGPQPLNFYKDRIDQFIPTAHPPNLNSHRLQSWDTFLLDHEQDYTAPPPTPQLYWQGFTLDGPQPSGSFQGDTWQFLSPQQPDPQNLHLDCTQPSGPPAADEVSEPHYSSAQLPILYNLHSEESQPPMPFQEGGWSEPQNVHLDWLQPSEPSHEHPFKEGDWADLQNLHLDWSLPPEPFHEHSQYSSAQSLAPPAMQNLHSEDLQPLRPLQGGCTWPDQQNFPLDGSQPSGLFQWEECFEPFADARQRTAHPITISFWDRTKYEGVKR